jgi:glutamine amidotransferase
MPGLGSFDNGIHLLRLSGFFEYILDHIYKGKPFIGICLGMQILFNSSDEGKETGLSIIDGHFEKLCGGLGNKSKTPPNIGYNFVEFSCDKPGPIIMDDLNGHYYFLHSYALKTTPKESSLLGASLFENEHYYSFFKQDNICGFQFHPERSGNRGLLLISRIINSMLR